MGEVIAMYCPACGSEYVNGVTACADCGAPLVAALPPASAGKRVFTLRRASALAVIGVSYIFAVRTLGTLLPGIYRNISLLRTVETIGMFAGCAMLVFYSVFYRDFIRDGFARLRSPAILVIAGSGAVLLLHMRELARLFEARSAVNPYEPRMLTVAVPWLATAVTFTFFAALFHELRRGGRAGLGWAAGFNAAGLFVVLIVRTIITANYFYANIFSRAAELIRSSPALYLPPALFSYVAALCFLGALLREPSPGERGDPARIPA